MVKKTNQTTAVCRLPIPSCEFDIVTVISQLVDTKLQFEAADGALDLHVTTFNAFTQKTTAFTAVSLVGIVRYLTTNSDLWDGEQGQVESWIRSCEQTLMPILRNKQQGDLLLETVQDFINRVDAYLFQNDQTFLVGDNATAADVCLAIPLTVIALEHFTSLTWPQQSFRWVQTVLSQLEAVVDEVDSMAWSKWKGKLKEGEESPSERPAPAVKTAATSSAAVRTAASTSSAAPVAAGDNKILNLLAEYGLEHKAYEHALSMTAEELVANVPLPEGETHTKNLFLRDKKHGLFLITVATNPKTTTHVDTKNLGKLLGLQGKTNLRLADEALLMEHLQAKPGCVGPLCAALAKQDADPKVQLVLDDTLLKNYSKIHSHPLRNDMSVAMTPDALQEYLKKAGVEPMIIEFGTASDAGATALPGKVPSNRPPAAKQPPKPQQEAKKGEGKKPAQNQNKKTVKKGETLLALQWKKSENFAMWYSDVIVLSEMIAYYDISGCYILRPWSYKIWELMQEWFNEEVSEIA